MFDGAFRAQSLDDAWNFYEWIAKDTYKWDMKMMYIENQRNSFPILQTNTFIPHPIFPHNDLNSNVYDIHAFPQSTSNSCMMPNELKCSTHELDIDPSLFVLQSSMIPMEKVNEEM